MIEQATEQREEYDTFLDALKDMPSGTAEQEEATLEASEMKAELLTTEKEAHESQKVAIAKRNAATPSYLRPADRSAVQTLGYDVAMEVFDSDGEESGDQSVSSDSESEEEDSPSGEEVLRRISP